MAPKCATSESSEWSVILISSPSPSVSGRKADWKQTTKISSKPLHSYHQCLVPMPFHTLVKAFANMLVNLVNWFCGMSLCRNLQPQRSTAPVWGLLLSCVERKFCCVKSTSVHPCLLHVFRMRVRGWNRSATIKLVTWSQKSKGKRLHCVKLNDVASTSRVFHCQRSCTMNSIKVKPYNWEGHGRGNSSETYADAKKVSQSLEILLSGSFSHFSPLTVAAMA